MWRGQSESLRGEEDSAWFNVTDAMNIKKCYSPPTSSYASEFLTSHRITNTNEITNS